MEACKSSAVIGSSSAGRLPAGQRRGRLACRGGRHPREAERTRVRARRSVPSEARFRFDSVAGQRSAAPRRPSRPHLVRSPRDVRAPADLNACRADAVQLPTPEEVPMSLDGRERAIDSAGSLSSRRTSPERGQRRLRHGTSAVRRKRRRQPAAPRQESLGVYPGVCPSGCLRPAQDVVPVRASPELPENADRAAAVLDASPRRQRFAADEAGDAYLAECPLTSPDGRFPPPASRTRQGLVAVSSPITRMRLVRVPGLDDGGDRAPSDQDRHSLESPTGDLRGPTGDLRGPTGALRGPRFLRRTRRVRAMGRIGSSPALPGASRVRPRRSRARPGQPSPRDATPATRDPT